MWITAVKNDAGETMFVFNFTSEKDYNAVMGGLYNYITIVPENLRDGVQASLDTIKIRLTLKDNTSANSMLSSTLTADEAAYLLDIMMILASITATTNSFEKEKKKPKTIESVTRIVKAAVDKAQEDMTEISMIRKDIDAI